MEALLTTTLLVLGVIAACGNHHFRLLPIGYLLGYSTAGARASGEAAHLRIEGIHSHLNGREWLIVHEARVWKEIERIIRRVDASQCKTKVSKEKRMAGKSLYAPIEINRCLKQEFRKAGWQESRTSYWVTDDYALIRKTLLLTPAEQKQQIEAAGRKPGFLHHLFHQAPTQLR
ncbi:MAG: hypothetical protein ACRD6I_00955 [Candidatus Acidiferrales bacterium]